MTYTLHEVLPKLSRQLPFGIWRRYADQGEALFIAYGCVLLERETGKCYEYEAVNIRTDEAEVVSRSTKQLTTSGVMDMLEKIRLSPVAGSDDLFDTGGDFLSVLETDDEDFIRDFVWYKLNDSLDEHERTFIEALLFA